MRITVGDEVRQGSGLGPAVNVAFQTLSLVATEAITALVPNFRRMSLTNKVIVNVAAGGVPVIVGIIASTVIEHKLQNSNVRQQGQQGQRR